MAQRGLERHRNWLARLGLAAATLTLLVAATAPAHAAVQQAPNSRVIIDLPAGFEAASLFSGFQNDRTGASYVVLEAPRSAYEEIARGFDAAALAARGIREATVGRLERSDQHVYMRARQTSPAGEFAKFFVVFATADQTVLVTANVPDKALTSGEVAVADVERALASAATVATARIRELYELAYLGPFKEAGRVVGTSKVYTLDGRFEPGERGQSRASFLVAPSLDKRPVLDGEAFAARLVGTLPGHTSIKPGAPTPVAIDGLDGYIHTASATDADGGREVRILHAVLMGRGGGYFRLIGFAPVEEADRLIPEFRRMVEGFKLVPQAAMQPANP
ncbi:MAG: hypothetical protein NW205_04805 [Hyphomicrobiaceae bacterium]|nr:hypothetical protein [Hyphomicrobiaceae bacterium]